MKIAFLKMNDSKYLLTNLVSSLGISFYNVPYSTSFSLFCLFWILTRLFCVRSDRSGNCATTASRYGFTVTECPIQMLMMGFKPEVFLWRKQQLSLALFESALRINAVLQRVACLVEQRFVSLLHIITVMGSDPSSTTVKQKSQNLFKKHLLSRTFQKYIKNLS